MNIKLVNLIDEIELCTNAKKCFYTPSNVTN